MRKIILPTLLLCALATFGQNEFAATAFYNDFKKIYADAQAGFVQYKGSPVKNRRDLFTVKLMIPLADSARILKNATNSFVEYYFQPARKKQEADKRAVNLRMALLTAYEAPVTTKTETPVINNYPYSTTYFFADPALMEKENALFWYSVYQKDGRYHLSLHIPGKL